MGKYDDIINLPHHVSDYHRPMPMRNRAAQFAPFAALSGHEDAILETQRLTEKFKELSEEEINNLSRKLNYAVEKSSPIRLTYFVPDRRKVGGSYKSLEGTIKKWDEADNSLLMKDGTIISVNFISEIDIMDNIFDF